ncbi:S-layer homology domain-containing protein [Lysinibacillus piscis]|uniref:SLH domain-containing protein n=1 Tax=Lysinibacillus piscis TaxID=2518931 RepID=A0ABQ5NHM6_9BACI|nr:S-layer homology domain-containing protein [Lysinibacillus sp. KH24]GLC87868.1 hypothetical protein LYSBPC_09950 [Lysinibacillus sp. KH24]
MKQKYSKWIIGAASTALVASAIVPVASAASFTDIAKSDHKENILALADAKIVGGYPDGTFKPNALLTRGNVTKFLGKWLVSVGYDLPTDYTKKARFTDLPTTAPDKELLQYAALVKDVGIFKETENKLMHTSDMTREQMAVLLVRAAQIVYDRDLVAEYKTAKFKTTMTDLELASSLESREAIVALEYTGLTTVKTFNPKNTLTRGQFASFLNRTMTKIESLPVPQPEPEVLTVKNVKVIDATTLEVTLSNDKTHKVTLSTPLPENEVTKAEFKIDGVSYSSNVTYVVTELKVKAATSVSATQVAIQFNKAVDAKTVFKNGLSGEFLDNILTLRSIDGLTDGTLTGELSVDGKVLKVTSSRFFEKRYDVIVDKVKALDGNALVRYNEIVNFAKDVVAPTIVSAERITATQVKVKFSEPMASAGSISFRAADGTPITTITGQNELVDGGTAIILNLSNVSIPTNRDITATVIAAADRAGNLINPNPATVTFQKGDKDGIAPTVTNVTQTGAKTFEIQYSEAIVGKPNVTIDNMALNPASIVIDAKNPTKVVVTAPNALEGNRIIAIAGAVDGSGEVQAPINRVVQFVKDSTAPTLLTATVVQDVTDKAEYLEFVFNKNVDLTNSFVSLTGGSYVKDYITNNVMPINNAMLMYKSFEQKNVVRVKLATLLGNNNAVGAKYAVNLLFSGVTSEAGVPFTAAQAEFVRGVDGTTANTDMVAVSSIAQGSDNDTVVVTFNRQVDAETATNKANYIIQGAEVVSASVNAGNLNTVMLKLREGSNTFTGYRNVIVQNIKAAGSSVFMLPTTLTVDLKENVRPTVVAELQTDLQTIRLTFSENVYQGPGVAYDYSVYIGTELYQTNVDVLLGGGATNVATILLPTKMTADNLMKGLTLKPLSTIDIRDIAGNKLTPADLKIINW